MNNTHKLLAAVILLSGIVFAGNSQAQTTTGTVALTPSQTLDAAASEKIAAKDWDGLIALAESNIIGNYIADPGINGWTDTGYLNNHSIDYVITATGNKSGWQAAHDYAASKLAWQRAATITLNNIKSPQAAIAELQKAISANPSSLSLQAYMLQFRARAGQNVNTEIVSFITSRNAMLDYWTANNLYGAFNTIQAQKADVLAFYDLLLQSVESNQANAAFIAKVIDQKDKLTR